MPATAGVVTGPDDRPRCPWALGSATLMAYHDAEWGQVLRGDEGLFERLCLEGFQSGLSWRIILDRRDALRDAFAGFTPAAVARFSAADIDRLMADPRIIRNRAKITSVVSNAHALLALQRARGADSLDAMVWAVHRPGRSRPQRVSKVPSQSAESAGLAAELRLLGFRFVGPTTVYSLMQAIGVVDDHLAGCLVPPVTPDFPGRA